VYGVVKIKEKTQDILTKIVEGGFLLFLVYLIIELFRKILGGSLGFEEVVLGLLITNLGFSFYLREHISQLDSKISGHIGWHKGKNNK